MKDVNTILQETIYNLLTPVVSVPVYYKYLPAKVPGNAYVLVSTITNIDASTQHTNDTDTTVQIGIYSRDNRGNQGQQVNDIAASIYSVIYPDNQTKLDLQPDFQNTSIALVNDVVPDAIETGNFIYINRFLTFRFNIFHH